MGAYAALQLGPDALNLAGARHGAERLASELTDRGYLDRSEQLAASKASDFSQVGITTNYYDLLGSDCCNE